MWEGVGTYLPLLSESIYSLENQTIRKNGIHIFVHRSRILAF